MSNCKMLIDATHPEETRVVVQRNGRVEEFDFESAARKLLRGNIYLAKVTRVEPSLQAAFVDYGGNRHGFLAFNEIHPDYYQIPVADRQALIDEEAAAEAELEAAADRRAEALERRARQRADARSQQPRQDAEEGVEATGGDDADHEGEGEEISNIVDVGEDEEHIEVVGGEDGDDDGPTTFAAAIARDETISETIELAAVSTPGTAEVDNGDDAGRYASADVAESPSDDVGEKPDDDANGADNNDEDVIESTSARDHAIDDRDPEVVHPGEAHDRHEPEHHEHHEGEPGEAAHAAHGADMLEEMPARTRRRPRSYKIQEVIKRRQVILVQVVKEERGNKGAALTTYLSLAGRYTVLMPNTARGGGISRKITNPQDRKRLKAIAQELDVPEGMGLIIRTAGAARTKQEIKRDFEYLLRLWESVRDLTLQSTAPSLVYEEGDLIKRSIRDLYNKDVEEVVVAGEGGYREAADFMRMLLPSHSKNVILYDEPAPLFARYGIERQLNAMFSPQVTLRSGGYIVINQTEALVSIDVNSGKSTREFSIEETALATNLEAADEIARQLKLRDLAGLIVIDFIDMEEKRNNRAVERRLKDALRHDRARIQLGRISHFGLMEMSRQRLRTGVLEGSTSQCQHCQGTGIIRSTESIALAVLRGLEDAITAGAHAPLIATTTTAVALYILNSKRAYVADMEARHGYSVTVLGSDRVHGANFTIERGQATASPLRRPERAAVNMDWGFEGEDDEEAPAFEAGEIIIDETGAEDAGRERQYGREGGEEEAGRRRRRRRRGRRTDRGEEVNRHNFATGASEDGEQDELASTSFDDAGEGEAGETDDHGEHVEAARGPAEGEEGGERRRRRRRGRRGGRRSRGERDQGEHDQGEHDQGERDQLDAQAAEHGDEGDGNGEEPSLDLSMPQAPGERQPEETATEPVVAEAAAEPGAATTEGAASEKPARSTPRGRQRAERKKPERLWDAPAGEAAEEALDAAAKADIEAEAPRDETAVEIAKPAEAVEEVKPLKGANGAANGNTLEDVTPVEDQKRQPRPRRHELGSSEPRIEHVVMRPDQSENPGSEAAPAPQRKGWWQRRFGGE
ncbi:MAG TPA: Rne/Rng family ribonuclease [Hyphomicrobium sp.]|nr:Rne/Rng family ribonuclease [Hyphomicrobium sp.]